MEVKVKVRVRRRRRGRHVQSKRNKSSRTATHGHITHQSWEQKDALWLSKYIGSFGKETLLSLSPQGSKPVCGKRITCTHTHVHMYTHTHTCTHTHTYAHKYMVLV